MKFNASKQRTKPDRGLSAPVALAVIVLIAAALADGTNGSISTLSAAAPPPDAGAASSCGGSACTNVAATAHAPIKFSGGAPSVNALLDEFMIAVEQRDVDALHRLRVTKHEYQGVIVPGFVPKGHPPRVISDKPREFFWELSDTKSRYFAKELVDRFGGRHYVERRLSYTKGIKEYAWYTALGEVELVLRTANDPDPFRLRTGTIAELDGRYKFISFEWDD